VDASIFPSMIQYYKTINKNLSHFLMMNKDRHVTSVNAISIK